MLASTRQQRDRSTAEKNQRERHAYQLLRLDQQKLDSRPYSSAHEHETAARLLIQHGTHELKSRVRQHVNIIKKGQKSLRIASQQFPYVANASGVSRGMRPSKHAQGVPGTLILKMSGAVRRKKPFSSIETNSTPKGRSYVNDRCCWSETSRIFVVTQQKVRFNESTCTPKGCSQATCRCCWSMTSRISSQYTQSTLARQKTAHT